MNKPDTLPTENLLDQYSKDVRMSTEIDARIKLEELQKEDDRFNDPMMAYKYLSERFLSI